MTILTADKWLDTTLKADATLQTLVDDRIYEEVAPEQSLFPCIVFQFVSGLDVKNASVDPVMVDEVWIVKAIGQGNDFLAIEPIVTQIGQILHKTFGTGVIGCVQEEPFRYTEFDNGVIYKHLGYYYRLFTQ
jgi:hypothetical protein